MLQTTRFDLALILRRHADDLDNKRKPEFNVARDIEEAKTVPYLLRFISERTGAKRREIEESFSYTSHLFYENKRLKSLLKENGIKIPKRKRKGD